MIEQIIYQYLIENNVSEKEISKLSTLYYNNKLLLNHVKYYDSPKNLEDLKNEPEKWLKMLQIDRQKIKENEDILLDFDVLYIFPFYQELVSCQELFKKAIQCVLEEYLKPYQEVMDYHIQNYHHQKELLMGDQ